jgi:lysine-specific histone demethylase 1B
MQDALISRFSEVQSMVKLSTPIKSIKYGADPIILTAADNTEFQANLVIVTVPISVIKGGGISFSPGLPAATVGSLAKLDMKPCIRLILEFKKNFWGTSGPYVWGSENMPEYFSAGMNRGQFNATLCVTVYGQKAKDLSDLASDDARIDAVLADFDAIYAGQATQFIRIDPDTLKRIYIIDDWTNREYILGGMSFPLAGATQADRGNIGKSVSDKLFFAGEATDISGQAGTVNGALASAERVVQEVVTVIKAL